MKGCQRRVILLKNTGSDLFDEAYFIVRREVESQNVCEDSMIAAANRIISESIELEGEKRKIRRLKTAIRICAPLLIGILIGIGFAFII